MRNSLIVAAAIAAIPSVALAQPAPPAAPSAPPTHTPHANLDWNANRFHFDYNHGGCHLAYNYDFKSGDMHLDRHGDCADMSIPHS
jgi:hypothetical protein